MTYVQIFVSGLLLGGIYALQAMGLTLIFGIMKLINFAHGDYLVLGMYLVYFLFRNAGIHPYAAIPLATLAMFVAGVLTQHLVLRPFVNRGHMMQGVVTLGISTVLQSLILMAFSADFRSVRVEPPFGGALRVAGVAISTPRLVVFAVAVITTVLLLLLLDRTLIGKAMRATAQDQAAAQLMGIPVGRIYLLAMGIGTALVGTAAAVAAPIFAVHPSMGLNLVLLGFVAVVLGGLGNVLGAFVGGLLLGVLESVTSLLWSGGVSQVIYFLLFVAILILRPQGLLRGEAG